MTRSGEQRREGADTQRVSDLGTQVQNPGLSNGHVSVVEMHQQDCFVYVGTPTGFPVTRQPAVYHSPLHVLLWQPAVPLVFATLQPPLLARPLNVNTATQVDGVIYIGWVSDLQYRFIMSKGYCTGWYI